MSSEMAAVRREGAVAVRFASEVSPNAHALRANIWGDACAGDGIIPGARNAEDARKLRLAGLA